MTNVIPIRQPSIARLECSACGATADAACDCGAPYLPAGQRAAEAIKTNPKKSNRMIADEIGVSEPTVRRARKAGASPDAPEKRTGRDGKSYPAEPVKTEVEVEDGDQSQNITAVEIETLIKPILNLKTKYADAFAEAERYGSAFEFPDATLALYDALCDARAILTQLGRDMRSEPVVERALDERNAQKIKANKDRLDAIRAEWKAAHPGETCRLGPRQLSRWRAS